MRNIKASDLILDFDVLPRGNINTHNIRRMCESLEAGKELPPVIVEKKTHRVVDGFHRVRAFRKVYGPDVPILCLEKNYPSDAELFEDAMFLNSSHGERLDNCDRVRCILIAEGLGLPLDRIAGALNMTVDTMSALRNARTAMSDTGEPMPLKNTVRKQFRGRTLTKRQVAANVRLSGMNQSFYVNQLIELIESEMLDMEDEILMDRLSVLHTHLDSILATS